VELARAAGASVSLDLIFAAPHETLDQWRADVHAAVVLQPDHVSTYGLTFERGTTFWGRLSRGELNPADEELERAMYAEGIDLLTAAGFEHYEVSNFARPRHRCRHNQVYWEAAPYYAAGPGAARYVDGCRQVNHRSTTTWMKRVLAGQSPVAESEILPPEDRAREALVLGLRRIEGVAMDAFARRFGYSVESLFGPELLQQLIDQGLFACEQGRLRLTREGLYVSDSLWSLVLRC
jgi:oxygen-independent coproporphyrinogen-3 oxidase